MYLTSEFKKLFNEKLTNIFKINLNDIYDIYGFTTDNWEQYIHQLEMEGNKVLFIQV